MEAFLLNNWTGPFHSMSLILSTLLLIAWCSTKENSYDVLNSEVSKVAEFNFEKKSWGESGSNPNNVKVFIILEAVNILKTSIKADFTLW